MRTARLFIRDDDVWTLDQSFRFFFDHAMERQIPVVYAVIPGKLEKAAARFLCRAKEKTPHLLDIVQHGWMHANHSVRRGIKYEFGASRSLKEQREDISQGLKQMRAAFGKYFTPAFVPPYHGYDERTLKALDQEGFGIFAAGNRRAAVKRRFLEIPAHVSFTDYGQGKKDIRKAVDVTASLARGIYRRPVTGLVTHHADFKTAAGRKELVRFFNFIDALRRQKEWQVLLFSGLERKNR
jgi:predicted deacetylase